MKTASFLQRVRYLLKNGVALFFLALASVPFAGAQTDAIAGTNASAAALPGTAISSAPFTISASGSYYLTANLTVSAGDAIVIKASGVSLNLNGFTISSTRARAAGTGIRLVRPNSDITICNGHILGGVAFDGTSFSSGPGFQTGIGFSGSGAALKNVRVSGVSVSGVSGAGIVVPGDACVVEHCVVAVAGGGGVAADGITDSVATNCGDIALRGVTVANSTGYAVQGGIGIATTTATNCVGMSDTGTGLSAQTVTGCYGSSGGGKGIDANSVNGSFATGTAANTRLLFPFASNTAGFDTAITISNTGVDSTGTIGTNGTATFYFYGSNAPAAFTTPTINAGTTYSNTMSTLAPGFQGYIEVDCNFPLAHGFGFFSDLGARNLAAAVPALVLPPVRSTALPESLGQ